MKKINDTDKNVKALSDSVKEYLKQGEFEKW